MRLTVAILGFILLTAGCSENNDSAAGEEMLTLASLEKGVIVMEPGKEYQRKGFSLRVDSVMNDSRCARGVNCIWAGNVEVRFHLQLNAPHKGQEIPFTLNTNPSFQRDTVILGTRYKLIDVSPHPRKDTPIAYGDYRVTVSV